MSEGAFPFFEGEYEVSVLMILCSGVEKIVDRRMAREVMDLLSNS